MLDSMYASSPVVECDLNTFRPIRDSCDGKVIMSEVQWDCCHLSCAVVRDIIWFGPMYLATHLFCKSKVRCCRKN